MTVKNVGRIFQGSYEPIDIDVTRVAGVEAITLFQGEDVVTVTLDALQDLVAALQGQVDYFRPPMVVGGRSFDFDLGDA